MAKWTQAQQEAIDARNPELLVSAAAGSGKTAVLVERIIRLAAQGAQLDRMLIVTFTRAAAGEMRERIQSRLAQSADQGDAQMHRQLTLMENCQISTLHGFCQRVLREHFQAVGLDPQTKLCDPALGNRLFHEAAQEAMLACFERADPDFDHLAQRFEQSDILSMMEELYTFLMSLQDPWGWLENQLAPLPDSLGAHPWTQALLADLNMQLQGLAPLLRQMRVKLSQPDAVEAYESFWKADQALCREILAAGKKGMEALHQALEAAQWRRAPTSRGLEGAQAQWVEDYKALRESLKKLCQEVKKQSIPSLAKAGADMAAMAPSRRGLALAVKALDQSFARAKEELGVMDFNDLEHLTLRALEQPGVREALGQAYDHIFVDEYQDVSQIQEAILQSLHGPENLLFMVGDVKQSIYRFRLADPTLFLSKQERFSKEADAPKRKLVLQQNFRSQPQVLQGVNQVFDHVMRREVTEIAYDGEARLVPGRCEAEGDCLWLNLVLKAEENPLAEYQAAAQLVLEALENPLPDGKGGLRPCQLRDIAILMPKTKGAGNQLAQVLKDNGIPVYLEGDEEYFDLPEIHTVMETLKAVDNPLQDLPLLTALSLPCFELSRQELALIRLEDQSKNCPFHRAFSKACLRKDALGEKCRRAEAQLEEWRFLKENLPLDQMIWRLISDAGIYCQAGALPGGENRQGNLRLLCQRAYEYAQSQSGGLAGFLKEGEALRAAQDGKTAKLLGEGENLVRVMTIHKSKGLEFPVTLVVGLGQAMHLPAKARLRLHKELGLALPYVNPEDRITRPTLAMAAIALRQRMEEKAERARLLYVAMTRARERLVLIGAVKRYPLSVWQLPMSAYGVYAAGSLLDWVCQALWKKEDFPTLNLGVSTDSTDYPQGEKRWKIRIFDETVHKNVENPSQFHTLISQWEKELTEPVEEEVASRLKAASQAPNPAELLPLKTSVSALCRQAFAGAAPVMEEEEEDARAKGVPQWTVAPLQMSPLPELPAFLAGAQEEARGAARGTAVHQALSALDYAPLRGLRGEELRCRAEAQLDEMAARGYLTRAQRDSVQAGWLCRFLESPLGRRALAAPWVKREWAFNFRLPGTQSTLVQGVIDLCFQEAEAWVLADYKTDYYEDPALLKTRYQGQLRLYGQALAAITGKPVKELWLFGLRRGDALLIEGENPL